MNDVLVVRDGVQLAAHVEDVAAVQQARDALRTGLVLRGLRHRQGLEHLAVGRIRRAPQLHVDGLARHRRPPVRIHVPVDEARASCRRRRQRAARSSPSRTPVASRRCEGPPSLAFWPPRCGSSSSRMAGADLLVDAAVLRVGDIAADIGIVRLVPDAPVPVLHLLAAPLLEAAPDDLAAAGDEIADVARRRRRADGTWRTSPSAWRRHRARPAARRRTSATP